VNALLPAGEQHPWLLLGAAVGANAIFNALVQALPKPTENSGSNYRYLYRAAHFAAMNFQYAVAKKFPAYVPPEQEKP
jgi:hypothetical protein